MRGYLFTVLLVLAGCATGPTTSETEREIVLKYVGVDAGTTGPFTKKAKHEINILTEKDRAEAASLLDYGAVGFLVFSKTVSPSTSRPVTRVILLQHGRIVGDFTAP